MENLFTAVCGMTALWVGGTFVLLARRRMQRPTDWWTLNDWLAKGDYAKRGVDRDMRRGRPPTPDVIDAMSGWHAWVEMVFGAACLIGGAWLLVSALLG